MAVKNKDFVEIEYTGRTKEDNAVFDTTDKKTAQESGVLNESAEYGPVIVCIGEGHILPGLESQLEGKEEGKSYKISLSVDEAFGRKNAKFIQLINTRKFQQQNVQPVPGLQVFIDGKLGTIKTVSGGRTLVDFNHPLAGKGVVYDVKVNRIVSDNKEKVSSYLKLALNLKDINITVTENEAEAKVANEIPKEIIEELTGKIKELTGLGLKITTEKNNKQ